MNKRIKMFEEFTKNVDASLNINKIIDSYLETALWTEEERMEEEESMEHDELYGSEDEDEDGEEDGSLRSMIEQTDFSIINISDDSKIKAYTDIKKFLNIVGDTANIMDESELGHDLWLTRNGHGAGFWDRGYSEEDVKILVSASEILGEISFELGDDGIIRFTNEG